jgi:hypothetical protein
VTARFAHFYLDADPADATVFAQGVLDSLKHVQHLSDVSVPGQRLANLALCFLERGNAAG